MWKIFHLTNCWQGKNMKLSIIATSILCAVLQPILAEEPDPVFALIEYNPWAMVMGADSPSFVLYEDSTVIFLRKESDKQYAYYSCNIASNNLFQTKLNLSTRQSLTNSYELSSWTDQPTTVYFWTDKKISVYGSILEPPSKIDEIEDDNIYKRDLKLWKTCPGELRELLKEIKSFDSPSAKKWLPENIEVMFWPYEYAPDESIVWPKDWPDLETESTVKRGKDSYSVYVPSEHYSELINFLKTRNRKGAVLINGKKMSSSIRFPFPKEKQWMK
jgi:hypothetical protein